MDFPPEAGRVSWRKPHPLLIAAALFALNVALNAAFFLPGEGKYRDSIEAGYASMAHFISQYPNPFGWNPFQYCGLPTHMWYLPGMPYLGALAINLLPALRPEHVYRLVAASLACMGPATLFLLSYYFSRSRKWALAAALLYTFSSVSYGIFQQISSDRGVTYLPWRMQVLTKYGEGPHNAGLMLLPLAMIACWRCAVKRDYSSTLLAAILLAAITLTNWIAAMALAWCVLMMLLAGIAGASGTGFLARRLLTAAGLAYLLACFWLTPRFIQTTLLNWPLDAFNYKVQTGQYLLLGGMGAVTVLVLLLFRRLRGGDYLCWLSLCLAGFAWVVCNHYWFRIDTIPESRRYALEMEFFLALIFAELLRLAFASSGRRREIGIAALAWICAWASPQAFEYVTRSWIMLRPMPRQESIEYQVAEFIHGQRPQGRVFVSGGTRFRLNSWFLIPQLGGTFESGLRIRLPVYLIYHLRTGLGRPSDARGPDAVRLLQFAGVEYVAIHGPASREHWRDIANPDMFEGLLERVYGNDSDAVYKLPFAGLAHLMLEKELPPREPVGYDGGLAEPYVRAIADASRPRLRTRWEGSSAIHIDGSFPPEMLVSLQVLYDGGWRAWQDGQPLEVGRDTVGYILLRPQSAGSGGIRLQYLGTREHRTFAAFSGLVWVVALAGLWLEQRRRSWKA
jgi:hypothetical protein